MAGRPDAEALLSLVDTDPDAVLAAESLLDELAAAADPTPVAIALRARALAYAHLEKMDLALDTIERALAQAPTEDDVVGGVEMTAGALTVWGGNTERGLSLLRRASSRAGVGSEAGVQLGASLYRLGRYAEALDALESARTTLDPGDAVWWSRLETNLGLTLAALGRTGEARQAINRSIELDRDAGHARGVATGFQNLGWVASVAGDLPAAFEYYEEAATRLARLGTAELWRDRADALLSAGFVDEAVAATRASAEALAASGHATAATEAKLKLAQALLVRSDWAEAGAVASAAAEEFLAQERPGWATYARSLATGALVAVDPAAVPTGALLELAEELEAHGFSSPAQDFRARAITTAAGQGRAAEVDDVAQRLVTGRLRPQSAAAAWLARAEVHRSLGRRREALRASSRGMNAVEDMSAALGGSEARAYASRSLDGLASLALELTRSAGRPRRVFEWIERARAGSLRLPRVTAPGDEVSASLVAELRSLERSAVALRPGPDLEELFRQRGRLEARIRHRARALRGDGGHSRGARAVEALDRLEPGEAILELAVSAGQVFGVLLHRGHAREIEFGAETAAIAAQQRVLRSLGRAARRPGEAQAGAAAADLRAVPLDLGRVPASVETLVVVPPPSLYALPWAMLPVLADRIVSVAPSATAALAGEASTPGAVACLVGTGLLHAESEARRVAGEYDRAVVLGAGADVEHALGALDGADVGHLVCHGTFRGDSPLFSSLALAGGSLFLHELERLARPPSMMVLSACDLGASAAVSAGEGLGAVTALIAAGVRTVIASSLLVPDHEVVGDVMVAFHRELRTGTRPAEALDAARRTLDQGHPLAPVLGALQCHGRW